MIKPPGSMGHHPVADYRARSGFTMIELIVVLVITVSAMAIVGPNVFKGLSSLQLKSATRDIASALRFTRTQAVFSAEESEFQLNVDENIYRVSGREKHYVVPDSVQLKLVTAESEIDGDGQGVIRFFPDGSSTGGRVSLIVDTRKRHIDVNWLTGQVTTRVEE